MTTVMITLLDAFCCLYEAAVDSGEETKDN
jgi:hypothetical protein